jgi:hypothetical protein
MASTFSHLRLARHLVLPLALAVTVPTVALSFPTTAWAQGKTLKDSLPIEARGHWDAGIALAQKATQTQDPKTWASARTSFYEAYKVSNNPRVLFNVAVCEKNIQQFHKAYQTIQKELDDGKTATPPLNAAEIKEATEFKQGLEKFVAKVSVDVDPKDAEVFLNDDKLDLTKPGPYLVSIGESRVVAKKPGFADAVQKLELAGGATGTATLKLLPLERTSIVNVAVVGPQRATVKVDGQEIGYATAATPFSGPVKVQDTPHQISVEAPGFATATQTVTVKEGPPIFLNIQLAADQAKGKLTVTAKPEGSTIEIDGAVVGATRWEGPVDARLHQVSVKKTGYYTWTSEVDVPKGSERSVTATLNEDRNSSFVPWLIGTIVIGSAVIVGVVLLATPPDEKVKNGTLDPLTVSTQRHRGGFGFTPTTPGFSF